MKPKSKVLISFTIIILLLSGIILLIYFNQAKLKSYLSVNRRADADILVLEGWLPDYAVELGYNECRKDNYDLIVTTGIYTPDLDYYQIAVNGYMIFYMPETINNHSTSGNHKIEVLAHSDQGGIYSPHFNFYINDSLITDFTADAEDRQYGIIWEAPINEIDSVMIHFDNDFIDDNGDRNLYIKELIVDEITRIPYQYNSEFDMGMLDGRRRIRNNYQSSAEITRNKLIEMGIDSSLIRALTGKRTQINRTLTSVITFSDWIDSYEKDIKGINVISLGIHSRRTWMTYKRMIDRTINIGIISLPEEQNPDSGMSEYLKILKESVDLLYYWIILILF
jgi:hypothetical protein